MRLLSGRSSWCNPTNEREPCAGVRIATAYMRGRVAVAKLCERVQPLPNYTSVGESEGATVAEAEEEASEGISLEGPHGRLDWREISRQVQQVRHATANGLDANIENSGGTYPFDFKEEFKKKEEKRSDDKRREDIIRDDTR